MPIADTRTGSPARRWLQLGVASAGMGAAMWGLSIAGPQVGTAEADTGGKSSAASSASASDGQRSVRSVRTVRSAGDPRRAARAAHTETDFDAESPTVDERPVRGLGKDGKDAKEVAGTAGAPELTVEPTEVMNTAAPQNVPDAAPVPSPTRSWQSPYQRWVARSLDAWTTSSLAWIDSLQTSDRTKGQLEASFFTVRRTFFNQAPTIDPVQITGVLDGPVTGTVGGYDPDGDRIIYVLTRGPKTGSVQVNRDGTFTYTPGQDFDGVDAFRVTAIDIGFHTNLLQPFRPIGSNPVRSLINQGAVTFDFDYTEGAQYWTPERREALQRSADSLILYFRVLNPVVLNYVVRAQDDPDSSTLASAGSALISHEPGYWDTVVQHKLRTGVDVNGTAADGRITWNFGIDWALGDEVGADEFDFQSTAMHELLHSFGFLSMTDEPGDNEGRNWATLDRFLVTANGRRPIDRNLDWDTDYDAILTGQDGGLYVGGRYARAAYGGRAVPLYTPSPWEGGSSGSHTDDKTFMDAGQLMMNAKTGEGLGVRVLSAMEIGILRDIGYTVVMVLPVSA